MTAAWYTREEHAMRAVIWGSANSGMDILTSLINYGIGTRAESHPQGLAPWKGISIFLGSLTIVISVFAFFLFGTPREVRWLSEAEKRMAYARVVKSQTGSDSQKRNFSRKQVLETFKDPQTYFFFFTVLINSIPNGGTTSFGNLVYVSFGFTALETIAEGKIPQQALSIICLLSAGYFTLKKPGLRREYTIISHVCCYDAKSLLTGNSLHINDIGCACICWYACFGSVAQARTPLDTLGNVFHHHCWQCSRPK
jgi:hypothetical protein